MDIFILFEALHADVFVRVIRFELGAHVFMRIIVNTAEHQEVVGIWDGENTVELYSGLDQDGLPHEILSLDADTFSQLCRTKNPSLLAERIVEFMHLYDPTVVVCDVVAEVLLWGGFPSPEK